MLNIWNETVLPWLLSHGIRTLNILVTAFIVKILGETKPLKQWEVTGELRKRIKIAFDKAGIEIPFPQRVIHHYKHN